MTEDKRDRRLALIVLLTAFLLGLLVGKVWACDSYENCHQEADTPTKYDLKDKKLLYIKSICYKLDEISKKLDKPNTVYNVDENMKIIVKHEGDKTYSLSGSKCLPQEMGWDGSCHKDDLDEHAYSKDCEPSDIKKTWKRIENVYGENDTQVTWRKAGCYDYREPK